MSRTDTWMPLYIGDYLADTGRLTTLGHGAYLLILMDYWRNGAPPDDDAVLCGIARVDRKTWDRDLRKVIRSFFSLGDDGCLHQKRIDKERAHALDLSSKRRSAAMKKGQSEVKSDPPSEPDEGSNSQAIAHAIAEQEQGQLATHARVAIPSQSPSQEERKNPQQPSAAAPPKASPRGHRLPDDWQPDEKHRAIAIGLGLDPDAVREKFCDYWHAKAGAGARKLSWEATWRNWCKEDADRAAARASRQIQSKPDPFDWARRKAAELELELGRPIH